METYKQQEQQQQKKNNPKTNSTQIFKTQDHLKISISNLGSLASETPMWFYYIFM